MTISKILINGCSHTAGSECKTNYGKIIAETLGCDYVNIATPGGSNHKIMRSTIEYLSTHNDIDFVLIGWTTHERFEFSFDGVPTDYTLAKQSDNPNIEKFYRFADLHLADWELGLNFTLSYQVALQSYLINKNINYAYCNMFNSIPNNCQNELWDEIDKNKYIMPHSGFIEEMMNDFPQCFSKTKHAVDPIIHKKIAEKILMEMQNGRR